jgi:hypothetical protein
MEMSHNFKALKKGCMFLRQLFNWSLTKFEVVQKTCSTIYLVNIKLQEKRVITPHK